MIVGRTGRLPLKGHGSGGRVGNHIEIQCVASGGCWVWVLQHGVKKGSDHNGSCTIELSIKILPYRHILPKDTCQKL